MTIPTARLEEIRELAAKATPGKWTVNSGWTDHGSRWTGISVEFGEDVIGESGNASDEDWSHIANCDPQTISAIVSELIERRNKDAEHVK